MSEPYWTDGQVSLYLGDCREVPEWLAADVLVTDPPYPNNAGWFDDAISTAGTVLSGWQKDAIAFWTELAQPPVPVPLVAVHIWHRTNVNGRPYEPAFQFAADGRKRRSDVIRHATLLAARSLGRPAIGVEIYERYAEQAARRLSQGVLVA